MRWPVLSTVPTTLVVVAAALVQAQGRAGTHAAADGIEYAGLDVDAENVSGALALYTGTGYEVRSTTGTWRHRDR